MPNTLRKLTKRRITTLRREYEDGVGSRERLAKRHGITTVYLWKLAKENDWRYGATRLKALDDFSEVSKARLNVHKADIIEEHAYKLATYRDLLDNIEDIETAQLLEKKVEILLKCIKGERTAYNLPNEIKAVETKSENIFRVEDALQNLEAKKKDLQFQDVGITYEVLPPPIKEECV